MMNEGCGVELGLNASVSKHFYVSDIHVTQMVTIVSGS